MVSVLTSLNRLTEKQKSAEVEVGLVGVVRPTPRSWVHAAPPLLHPKLGLLGELEPGLAEEAVQASLVSVLNRLYFCTFL